MTILSDKTLRKLRPVTPFEERTEFHVGAGKMMTFGLSCAGYDIRIRESITLWAPHGSKIEAQRSFQLCSSIEYFEMPNNVMAVVHDKSSWARRGLSVFNTVIEPGWRGYLTLELKNFGLKDLYIRKGSPIAQVVFHKLDKECENPYSGKYQNQESGAQDTR